MQQRPTRRAENRVASMTPGSGSYTVEAAMDGRQSRRDVSGCGNAKWLRGDITVKPRRHRVGGGVKGAHVCEVGTAQKVPWYDLLVWLLLHK
jgi:hypothetical protein